MLHLIHLRIRHAARSRQSFKIIYFSSLVQAVIGVNTLVAGLFFSLPSHAELNVAGEEIIVYGDEPYKKTLKDFVIRKDLNSQKDPVSQKDSSVQKDMLDATIKNKELIDNIEAANPVAASPTVNQPNDLSDNNTPDASVIEDVNDDLWQRIKNGYGIPDSTSTLIAKHEGWYSSRPDYMKRMVERSQKYLFHIVEELEKRGMPTEIALLPMIESAYNPQAYSTSRASGIWQFIPSTGKHFGLQQNWWVDNRRNVTAATDAALTYLQKLHGMFGAWDLALAAYNAGEGTVGRAIARNRSLGLATDYESLNLPAETRNYVPKLQAIKNLMTNPNNYGLKIQTIANSAYFINVSAPAQIDAHLAAKLAGISDEEFLALNPSNNRPLITSADNKHELLLPITAAQTFKTNLASYNKPLVSWQTYQTKRGELMDKIAAKFGIQLNQLRNINNLPAQKKIKIATTILVPNGNKADFNSRIIASAPSPETAASNTISDNLIKEQESENINLSTLQNDNLPNDNVNTQTVIAVKNKESSEPVRYNHVIYKVKKGEHMQSIAERYGLTVKQVMALNSLKSNQINAGQMLTIKSTTAQNVALKSATKSAVNVVIRQKNSTYIVKRGDTLHSIAQKFDVAVTDIQKWNKNAKPNIQPGRKLTIRNSDAA